MSCALNQQLRDHGTSIGCMGVGPGYGSFLGRGPYLDLLSYGSETELDFLKFFDMGPYVVAVWGYMFKL